MSLRLAGAFCALVVGLSLQGAAFAASNPPQPVKTFDRVRLEGVVDGLMAEGMGDFNVAGATVAVVQDGQTLLAKGYGEARLKPTPRPVDADTLFQVASISKTFVYIAGMQLVEAGKLRMDDPINVHLPKDLAIPDQGFHTPIRVRDLFAHTAGFEDLALGHLFAGDPNKLLTLEGYLKAHRPKRVRAPGVLPSYSNYSLALLGEIIAHESGMGFEDYMEQKVLRPLGMPRASYRDAYTPKIAESRGLVRPLSADIAANATQQLAGGPGDWRVAGAEYTTQIAPAGGLKAGATDMSAYLAALMDPQRMEALGVLKAETFRKMIATSAVDLPVTVHHGFIPYHLPGQYQGFGHAGAMAFGASDLVVVPELKLGVFVSTNTRGGFAFAYSMVARMIDAMAPRAELPAVRTPETARAAASLAGAWLVTRRASTPSERAINGPITATRTITAKPNGDIAVSGLIGPPALYAPLGGGVWRSYRPGGVLVLGKGGDGREALFSGNGTQAMERASLFDTAGWMVAALIAALLAGVLTVFSLPRRLFERSPTSGAQRSAGLAIDAASWAWAIGVAGFVTVLAGAAPDNGARLMFAYPGPMVWIGWSVAAAVVLSILGVLSAAPALSAKGGWSAWRRITFISVILIYGVASLAAWKLGLIGFHAA